MRKEKEREKNGLDMEKNEKYGLNYLYNIMLS